MKPSTPESSNFSEPRKPLINFAIGFAAHVLAYILHKALWRFLAIDPSFLFGALAFTVLGTSLWVGFSWGVGLIES